MSVRALLVGISDYTMLPPLGGVRESLDGLAATLQGVVDEASLLQIMLNPGLHLFEAELQATLGRALDGDSVIVYLAGHSYSHGDEVSFLFSDADSNRPNNAGLTASRLSQMLSWTRAHSVLLIVDVDFGGAFLLPEGPTTKDTTTAFYLIAAAGSTETVSDTPEFAERIGRCLAQTLHVSGDLDFGLLRATMSEVFSGSEIRPFVSSRGGGAASPRSRQALPASEAPLSIFISYSHRDNKWLRKMTPHLQSLVGDAAEIKFWSDGQIQVGDDWQKEIRENMESARAAVLLISADFLASDFIRNHELPALVAQAEANDTRLYCVIIRPCRFDKVAALSRFQAVNGPNKTLSEMRAAEQERVFVRLTDQLEQALV